jgi:plastocyanin
MRRSLVALLVLAVAGATAAVTAQGAATINVGDDYFVRPSGKPTVNTKQGTQVTFRFVGRKRHRIKGTGPANFSFKARDTGSVKRTFGKAGTYTVICTIHGASDQSMKLVVKP